MITFHNCTISGHTLTQLLVIPDCSMPSGVANAVLGGKGDGKGRLLLAILGLVRPTAGTVLVENLHPVVDGATLREWACYVPRLAPFLGHLTVVEQVRLLAALGGLRNVTRAQIVKDLRLSELPDRLMNERCSRLTAYQRVCVWLAVHRVRQTRLLLLDDPSSTLAAGESISVARLIREQRQAQQIVVVTTEDPTFAAGVADRLWRITDHCLLGPFDRNSLSDMSGPQSVVLT